MGRDRLSRGCGHIKGLIGGDDVRCCQSCHEDAVGGFEACHVVADGKRFEVCCTVAKAYESHIRNEDMPGIQASHAEDAEEKWH